VLLPRAIAYSAGLIDFFFRGELEITPPPQRILAVVDQGVPHTVDGAGYPRRSSDNQIFGFEKVRLLLRNITPDIQESGSGNTFVQNLGGSDGPSVAKMVAVARYHRNPCYKPDLTGERRVPMPATGLFNPPSGCGPTGSRSRFQEISVSAQISVTPGQFGAGPNAVPVAQVFDFSNDPIPVNATDLFFQVIYRGPLGLEPDGIAMGTYDAREPLFVGYWNNTDYYVQNANWLPSTDLLRKSVRQFQLCAGSGTDRVILLRKIGMTGAPAMAFAVAGGAPGFMRAAVIGARPVASENIVFRGNVSFFEPQPPSPYLPQILGIKGTINQANKEAIGLATEPVPTALAPFVACPSTPAVGEQFLWCVEPVLTRRGTSWGRIATPIALSTTGTFPPEAGTLPAFPIAPEQNTGENLWDQTTLTACPDSLTSINESLEELNALEEELAKTRETPR
jgi:hypothetical protein